MTEAAGVREGQILAGKYRVDRVLGVGGMGVVVAAHHIELDERVAIKFLLPEVLMHGEAVARFAREARAAVKIKSEHVARVTDVGKLENGAPYMVMEYLEGSDLSQWIAQRGALPIEQAVEFLLQACEAIAEAHALGIVHRDLKPANLFVIRRPDGFLSVKVLDFGISKTAGPPGSGSAASMTRTSALMGSPLYMSPEQMQSSRDVDARTDIWALGVILYELLTGTQPFSADTMPELVLRVVTGPPAAAPRSRRPDIPDGLEQVIFRCLEKDRGRRFESVGELAVALVAYAPRRSKTSVERISGVLRAAGLSATALALPPSSGDEQPQHSGATANSWGRTASPKGRSRWVIVAAVVGAVLASAALGWRAFGERASGSAGTSSAAVPEEHTAAPLPPTPIPTAAIHVTPPPVVAPTAAAPTAAEPVAAPAASEPPSAPAAPFVRGGRVKGRPAVAKPAPVTTKPTVAAAPQPEPAPAPPPPPRPRPAEPKTDIFDDRK